MVYIRLFSLFSCIFTVLIALATAGDNDVASPRSAPLLAPQASTPSVDCNSLIYDMVDCISYLSVGSTVTQPDPECCYGYKTVLKTDAECVCEALKSAANLGFNIDMKRAGDLASACNIKAPSIDSCHVNPPTTEPSPISESPAPVPFASPTAPVPHASPASSKSPAPVPQASVSPKSPAPVPHTSPSPKSPALVPHTSPSPKSPAPVPPTWSPPKPSAPVPPTPRAPTPITVASTSTPKSSAYAIASSTKVHFIMLVASFFYTLA